MTAETKNIMLVDDDKFLLDMYGMKFTADGYNVQTCLSVHDAIATLEQGFAPAAILFDLVMPGEDGFSLLEHLSKADLAKGAIKIALTNQSSDEEKERALKMGADQYIIKATMIPSEVVNTVSGLIRAKNGA